MYKALFKLRIKERHTSRLVLRGFEASDLDVYSKILGHKDVAGWLGRPEGISKADAKHWIDGMLFWWERHGYGPWAVVEKESGRLVGHCGLKFAEELGATELMYAIHPDFHGRGYATEASRAALDYGKSELEINKIIAYTLPNNWPSRKVMEKIGMHYVKNIVHAKLDHVLYEINL